MLNKNKLLLLSLLLLVGATTLRAQEERTVIATVDGVEISYILQFIGTDEKKNPSKSKDEYQIIGYVKNTTGQDLYTTSVTPFRVEVNNANSLNKASKPTPQRTEYQSMAEGTNPAATLYVLKAGLTIQDGGKIKVQKGLTPIVNYEKQGMLKPLDQWSLQLNAAVLNGNWIYENNKNVAAFEFNATNNTIVQRNQGNTVVWYWSNGNVYERFFAGVSLSTDAQVRDSNAVYKATLSLTEDGRLMYQNSEGVTVYLKKQ